MPEVPRVETPFQEASIAELLRLELIAQRLEPHRDMCGLLLAQIAFETSRGRSCQNHNVGNLTAFDNPGGPDFYRPVWFELGTDPHLNQLHDAMKAGKAPRAFRAFPTFGAGVAAYVLAAKHLGVIEAARTGDASETARVIKTGGYTPDAPASLPATLETFRADYERRGLFETVPLDRAAPTPRDRGLLC